MSLFRLLKKEHRHLLKAGPSWREHRPVPALDLPYSLALK
jgi:hypothetical protein